MKIVIILVAIALAVIGIVLYTRPNEVRHWMQDNRLVSAPEVTRVYKWKDNMGNWHVTDKKPPEGMEFEVNSYRSDDNLLPVPPQLREKH